MYEIVWDSQPRKFLKNLSKEDAIRIIKKVETLKENPRNEGVIKLKGRKEEYRIRQGDYRIRFLIADGILRVIVIDIDHRKDVYKK